MKKNLILFLTLVYCITGENVPKLPSFFKICHRKEPNLNTCMKESMKQLMPYFLKGIPELNIPPYEPFYIDRIDINQSSNSIFLNSTFTEMNIYNALKTDIKSFKYDVDKNRFDIKQYIPHFEILSKYNLNGKIMTLPLTGNGTASFNVTKVNYILRFELETYHEPKTNQAHFKVKNISVNYDIGNIEMYLNMLNNEKILQETVNLFLNNNWKLIIDKFKPVLEETVCNICKHIIDQIFSVYPIDTLLPL